MRLALAIVAAVGALNVGFILWRLWAGGLLRVEPCSDRDGCPEIGKHRCTKCGNLVCDEHYFPYYEICQDCAD